MNGGDEKRDPSRDADDLGDGDDGSRQKRDAAEQWRFTLEDLETREAEAEAAEEARRRRREPIESGSPSLENTVFVLLGIAFALFVLSRLFVG